MEFGHLYSFKMFYYNACSNAAHRFSYTESKTVQSVNILCQLWPTIHVFMLDHFLQVVPINKISCSALAATSCSKTSSLASARSSAVALLSIFCSISLITFFLVSSLWWHSQFKSSFSLKFSAISL